MVDEATTAAGVKNVGDEQTTFDRVSSRTTVLRLEKLLNDASSIVASLVSRPGLCNSGNSTKVEDPPKIWQASAATMQTDEVT